MAQIKPFKCVRPAADMAATIAALPYDVYNREEAKEVVKNNISYFKDVSSFINDFILYENYIRKAENIL